MHIVRTSSSKETPPYGAFDDLIVIESSNYEKLLIRPEEFDFLTSKLFDNWKARKSAYIQLLKEWNECIGFNDSDENPSILEDINDTIDAINIIEGIDQMEYTSLTKEDVKLILDFFIRNRNQVIQISKEY